MVLAAEENLPRRSESPEMRIHHAIVAAIALAFIAAGSAEAAATLQPGTYRAVTPGTLEPAPKGNEVVLVRAKAGSIRFGINAIRALDNNTGYVTGSFESAGNVEWRDTRSGIRCRLRFVAISATRMHITQDLQFGDCGFGYAVVADGLYVRTRSTGTIAPWNGP